MKGADANAKFGFESTALMQATYNNHLLVVEVSSFRIKYLASSNI